MLEIDTICTAIQKQRRVLESGGTLDSEYEETLLLHIQQLTSLMKPGPIAASQRIQLLELCQDIKHFQDNNLLLQDRAQLIIKDFALQLQEVHIKEENNRPSEMKFVQLGNKRMLYKDAHERFAHPLRQKIVEFGISEFSDDTNTIIELKKQKKNSEWGSNSEQVLAARWLEKVSGKKIILIIAYEKQNDLVEYASNYKIHGLFLDKHVKSTYLSAIIADEDKHLILYTRYQKSKPAHYYYGRNPDNTPMDGNCAYWAILQAMAQHFSLHELETFIRGTSMLPKEVTTPLHAQHTLLLELLCDEFAGLNSPPRDHSIIIKTLNNLIQEIASKLSTPLPSHLLLSIAQYALVSAVVIGLLEIAAIALGWLSLINIPILMAAVAIPIGIAFCSSIAYIIKQGILGENATHTEAIDASTLPKETPPMQALPTSEKPHNPITRLSMG